MFSIAKVNNDNNTKNKGKDTRQLEAGFPYILPCSEYVCVEVCQLL